MQSLEKAKLIGRTVRSERKSQKLTQTELGELSGVGKNFISQLEQGKETIRLCKLLDVLFVLGVELQMTKAGRVIKIHEESME